jgi:hypothetical protein
VAVGVGEGVGVRVGVGVLVPTGVGVGVRVGDGVSVGRGGSWTSEDGVGSVGVAVGRVARALRSGVGKASGPQPAAVNARIANRLHAHRRLRLTLENLGWQAFMNEDRVAESYRWGL